MAINMRGRAAPEGGRGVLVAVGSILAICAAALAAGWLVGTAVSAAFDSGGLPEPPAWTLLVFTAAAFVPLLVVALRVMPWLQSWYYLLPAIVFLLAFTVYPILLTIGYAFTNFSSTNSGEPDTSTQLPVRLVSPTELRVTEGAAAAELRCATPDCAGTPVGLPDARGETVRIRRATVERVEGDRVLLASPLPAGFEPTVVHRVNPVEFVGLRNFQNIFAQASVQLWPVLAWTVIFAVSTTVLNILAGLTLGILLNNKRLKFRNVYRTLLILPWAVPGVISIQMWVVLFNTNFGGINRLLGLFGAYPIPWRDDELWAKAAILLVNLWLGFPYMMTATLGALAAVPDELYEAAEVDGASPWQRVRSITLPMLTAAFTPIALSTFAFNFNNFGIIYLLTDGGPVVANRLSTAQSTDILISWGYKTAFREGAGAYGPASAIAIIVAVLTIGIAVFNFRLAGVFKEARR